MIQAYRFLIGSLGDDSHSVGLFLLEIAFKEDGFLVKNIGILNTLEEFFKQASNFDAVFISCQNGHIDLNLKNYSRLKKRFERKHSGNRAWYLEANLSVQESDESVVRKYKRQGFDFASPKSISCDIIMETHLKYRCWNMWMIDP